MRKINPSQFHQLFRRNKGFALSTIFVLVLALPVFINSISLTKVLKSRADAVHGVIPGLFVSSALKTEPVTNSYSSIVDLCLYSPEEELVSNAEATKDKIADDQDNLITRLTNNVVETNNKKRAETLFVQTENGKIPMNRAIIQEKTGGKYNFLPQLVKEETLSEQSKKQLLGMGWAKDFMSKLAADFTDMFDFVVYAYRTREECYSAYQKAADLGLRAQAEADQLAASCSNLPSQAAYEQAQAGKSWTQVITESIAESPAPKPGLPTLNEVIPPSTGVRPITSSTSCDDTDPSKPPCNPYRITPPQPGGPPPAAYPYRPDLTDPVYEPVSGGPPSQNTVSTRPVTTPIEDPDANINPAGHTPPLSTKQIDSEFELAVDYVVDLDFEAKGTSSTIVDATNSTPVILREGEISLGEILKVAT